MVAPLIAAAGIGAAASLIGGITGGKGAKAAAKTQQQTTQMQIAANQANMSRIQGLSQPGIDRGNAAGDIYAGLLGTGGNPAASAAALDTYRGSVGYQDLLKTGLGAVNANAYARGLGDSGGTLKALQDRGMNIANQNTQQYLSNLNGLIQTGNSAIGNVAGLSTATTQANNAALQAGSNANQGAVLSGATAQQQALSNLANIGMNYASSYGQAGNVGGMPIGTRSIYGGNLGGIY
ncbi:hypothetical protein [Sphingomonas sp. S-NIH.Pt15_0812]|uniref:hypothetical protein n=1 Tax=Sphingomonas sp. S-NIH.Pt15_0812 TaxID=1920129 RepID=UPI000F7E3D2A|nr:hypothetical protein [Sphingomonas sp. S-NIH.Pt15_0812]RSU53994.1 hypothetical protein BRX43_03170 [Sphingomonas sp. S-NIH.Pt15_0812]